jgi:hypothetical protein
MASGIGYQPDTGMMLHRLLDAGRRLIGAAIVHHHDFKRNPLPSKCPGDFRDRLLDRPLFVARRNDHR